MKKLIAGNWKMNLTMQQAVELGNQLTQLDTSGAEVVLCAPYVFLPSLQTVLGGSKIKIGAQNVAWADSGAFTGEISPLMLKEIGVDYAIVGHSERRTLFGETDSTVNMRLKNALKHGIRVIFCVGETADQRESDSTKQVLERQISRGLEGISAQQMSDVVVAYEPVWAIGTGKSATAAEADEAIAFIRTLVHNALNVSTKILYGGSMNGANAAQLLSQKNIDGGLIGGASLNAQEFYKIILAAQGAVK